MGKPNARERILEAAGILFHKLGYANVGINEIIKQADTAKATFYQHFPSKESLCEAWLDDIHQRSEASRASIIGAPGTVPEKLVSYFEDLGSYLREGGYRGCPYTNTCAMVDEDLEGVLEKVRRHKDSILRFFETLVFQEFGNSDRTAALARQIFILYSGAASEAQNLRSLWPVESAKSAMICLLGSLDGN